MTESDDRIRRLLVESLDAELGDRLEVPSAGSPAAARTEDQAGAGTPTRTRRSWLMPVAAAAAVVVIAGGALAIVHEVASPDASGNAGGERIQVVCTASGGDASADRAALVARAGKLAGAGDVTSFVSGSTISVTVPGAKRSDSAALCSSTSLVLRPLIAPVVADKSGTDPHPLAGLKFAIPKDEQAYNRLTAAQQARIAAGLARSDCRPSAYAGLIPAAGENMPTFPVIACDNGSGYGTRIAALLGDAIVSSSQIDDAQAQAPSTNAGSAEWTVSLTFTSDGQRAFGAFTKAHNTNGSTAETNPLTCGTPSVACSDFVAFEVNGRIVSLPVTLSPIMAGTVLVSGSFTESSAKALAAQLPRGGELPVPLTLVSITPTP